MQDRIRIIYNNPQALRLDKFLAELRLQELYSRNQIERLIEEDRILVNLIPVKKSFLLKVGDEINIALPEPEPVQIIPQEIPLDVVFEDEHLAIINKPAGMVVHPGFGNPDQTLVNAIVHRWGENLSRGREYDRPGIVHRLDRGTSGLMIIAKSDAAQSALSEMFSHRLVQKTYLAITTGVPDPAEDSIESNISRSLSNPRKMCISAEGRWALTHYKIIRYYHCFALVKVKLETGRMHQIRVQFSDRNHPILGDLLYNTRRQVHMVVPENMKRKVTELLTTHLLRQALHAWRLEFVHPFTEQLIEAQAPLPEDILYTLKWLDTYFAIDTESQDINSLLSENRLW